ncbi:MAG: MFS transporter [Acidimicrobiia bacterium]
MVREPFRRLVGPEQAGAFALVGLAVLVISSVAFFRVPILPSLGADLHMSTVQLGAITTVFALGRLVADIPSGHLADRFGATGLMAAAALGVAVGSGVLGAAPAAAWTLVGAAALGLGASLSHATGMTYFSSAAIQERRGRALSLFSAALLGGQALGPAVAGLLAAAGSWRLAMGVGAAAALLLAAALAFAPLRLIPGSGSGHPSESTTSSRPRPLLRSETAVLQGVSFTMFFTLGSIPQTLAPVIGADELGLSAAAIGLALGIGGFARLAGTIIGGQVADRVSRMAALVPGLLVQAIGVALLSGGSSVATWTGSIIVMSLASFSIPVAATILGDRSPPGRVGAALGRFRFAGDLGLISGPVLVTYLYDHLGRPPAVLSVAALLTATALLSAVVLGRTLRSEG